MLFYYILKKITELRWSVMNYLAHIFLSGENERIKLGNFIADSVKGSSYNLYPDDISCGILLHRAIDSYTDNHPLVKEALVPMKSLFGRYSSALLDIYFDYLLASRFNEFSRIPLKRFSWSFYLTMIKNRRWLPKRIKRFMWHFISTNRLSKYSTKEGIRESLEIMVSTGRLQISVEQAIDYLVDNEQQLLALFRSYFPQLCAFTTLYLKSERK